MPRTAREDEGRGKEDRPKEKAGSTGGKEAKASMEGKVKEM
jgi:hypothetical protein